MIRLISSSLPGMARAENTTHVAGGEIDARMIVGGDTGKRGARLALAAGQDRDHLVARQVLEGLLVEERRHAVEHAEFGRHVD